VQPEGAVAQDVGGVVLEGDLGGQVDRRPGIWAEEDEQILPAGGVEAVEHGALAQHPLALTRTLFLELGVAKGV